MKVLKFGGKSLANGAPLESVLEIIQKQAAKTQTMVVLSARGNTTDILESLLNKAAAGESYLADYERFKMDQLMPAPTFVSVDSFKTIEKILEGAALLGDYTPRVKDQLLAHGELLSCSLLCFLLSKNGCKTRLVDTRQLIKTNDNFGAARVLEAESRQLFDEYFANIERDTICLITGFIGSTVEGITTTLGRNGSNYTATLVASFLGAEEVQNWTNVNGFYTADPRLVPDAKTIRHLSFREANELANFGMNILHAKTILPLVERQIPIRILNSFNPGDAGTLIDAHGNGKGIKTVSAIENVALISIEGRGLLGKVGIDGRIFNALSSAGISVRIISQASSERGIGFIINKEFAEKALTVLRAEFAHELQWNDISEINANSEVAVVSVISRNLEFFDLAYGSLIRNGIRPVLIANTINGDHISLVVHKEFLRKTMNIIHGHIFGVSRKLNVFLFGKGNVGKTFLDQLMRSRARILERNGLKINIFGICDTRHLWLGELRDDSQWMEQLLRHGKKAYRLEDLYDYVRQHNLENVVVIDNTASKEVAERYPDFVREGFDIVASNKHANTFELLWYNKLRQQLRNQHRRFYYETNVGAGLPLIDTIRLLHASGDSVHRIRGVFSGSLSFIFNAYSNGNIGFSTVLQQAMALGYTEPDPREDLSGKDVARKLLILARELDWQVELKDVEVESLIAPALQGCESKEDFLKQQETIDHWFLQKKLLLDEGQVLRYSGELDASGKSLQVRLLAVSRDSDLGSLSGSDSLFEIYTEAYGQRPLIIRGAGAGAEVTARGVFSDLLKLASA